jgi:hypothetical protein
MYSKVLIEFQQSMRINITGTFDKNTTAIMNDAVECLMSIIETITKRSLKRFILMGSKWLLNGDLTSKWKTSNLSLLKDIEVDSLNQTLIEVFKNATAFCEDASSVRFKYTPNAKKRKSKV